jgi:hypothetical protein
MNQPSVDNRITALAPLPEQLDQQWANDALARILADAPPVPSRWITRHRTAAVAVAGVLTLTTGTAFATVGLDPISVVKDTLLDFADDENTTGNDVGTIYDPQLVAQFERSNGHLFAVWIAKTSSGDICDAQTVMDSTWDGVGLPEPSQLEYGCAADIVDPTDPDRVIRRDRPDQLGAFFTEAGDTILYGISPYPEAVVVRVRGDGVDRILPVRMESLGYGAALPEATDAASLELTFVDSTGRKLGSKTVFASG